MKRNLLRFVLLSVMSLVTLSASALRGGEPDYLCFTAGEDGATVALKVINEPYPVTLQTSTDGNEWTDYTIGDDITLNTGNKVYFRNSKPASEVTGFSKDEYHYYSFNISNAKVAASGNVMSLVDKNCEATDIPCKYCFHRLFGSDNEGTIACKTLTSAPKLPATKLAAYCYSSMFSGCTALTTAPELPAEKLTGAEHCYNSMFISCTALETAPELPATTLAANCYNYMFSGCNKLTTAHELPATTLAAACYEYMFNGCKALTTAPELPATTLAKNCYSHMFDGCVKLTTAPELPATTLATNCYGKMFNGCSNLNDIKVAFTAWDTTDDEDTDVETAGWVANNTRYPVGTFTCPEELDTKTFGTNYVPKTKAEWTIKNTYDLEVTSAGWASMCVNLPLTVPEGAEVYYAFTALGGNTNTIALRQIKPGTVMAAKTAVIVKADASTTVSFPIASEEGVNYYEDIKDERNLFQGTSVDKTCEAGSVYVLAGADQDGMPLFRLYVGATTDATTVTLGAHKIWLPYDEVLDDAEAIQFRFDDATAISNVPMESNDNAIYNLAGQRVSSDYRGLVIKNGKKTWNN